MGHVLVLVSEVESALAELISMNLAHSGYEVSAAHSPSEANGLLRQALPDLVLHGWNRPQHTGLNVLKQWRSDARTRELPVIMLSHDDDEGSMVAALNAGADDYVVFPASNSQLVARMRAVLRRRAPEALDTSMQYGPLTLDPTSRRVIYEAHGERVDLRAGPTDFKVLRFFMANVERLYTRPQLLNRIWGDHVFIQERTVDVHIQRLRRLLAPVGCAQMLECVRGSGYRFTDKPVGTGYQSRSAKDPKVPPAGRPRSAMPTQSTWALPPCST